MRYIGYIIITDRQILFDQVNDQCVLGRLLVDALVPCVVGSSRSQLEWVSDLVL